MRFEHPSRAPAVAALLAGAVVWGLVWYPYRLLQSAGLSGVLASGLTYLVALLLGLIALRGAWRRCRPSWLLMPIGLAAGGCNLGYVLATLHGEVMRVLLLFYLSPLWTVLLAHMLLGEIEADRTDQFLSLAQVRSELERRWTLTPMARRTG